VEETCVFESVYLCVCVSYIVTQSIWELHHKEKN
jgi:hypothetical protein